MGVCQSAPNNRFQLTSLLPEAFLVAKRVGLRLQGRG